MAKVFIAARGCVFRPTTSSVGNGFYRLNPDIPSPADTPILIDGIDNEEGDIVFPVATLDSKRFVYEMGEDFGGIQVSGMAILGKADRNGQSFAKVRDYFNQHRVATSGTPVTASLPGNVTYRFYLTKFLITRPDPEFHIQFFSYRGVVVEPATK